MRNAQTLRQIRLFAVTRRRAPATVDNHIVGYKRLLGGLASFRSPIDYPRSTRQLQSAAATKAAKVIKHAADPLNGCRRLNYYQRVGYKWQRPARQEIRRLCPGQFNSRRHGPMLNEPFSTTGYAILPALLDCEALIEARAAVNAALTGNTETGMNRIGNDLVPLRWCDPCVSLILNRPTAIAAVKHAIGGSDLRWISAYITSKAPQSPPLFWHQDWWCWEHPVSFEDGAPQVAVLCYLSATSAETGALRVLPGSHRRTHDVHHHLPDPHSAEAHMLPLDHKAMMDCDGQETISLAPGDAAVIDYRLLHGTHPNTANVRRDALLLSFAPAWRILPKALRAHIAMHPALPRPEEWSKVPRELRRQLARYNGTPRSLQINRAVPLFEPSMGSGNTSSALVSER